MSGQVRLQLSFLDSTLTDFIMHKRELLRLVCSLFMPDFSILFIPISLLDSWFHNAPSSGSSVYYFCNFAQSSVYVSHSAGLHLVDWNTRSDAIAHS